MKEFVVFKLLTALKKQYYHSINKKNTLPNQSLSQYPIFIKYNINNCFIKTNEFISVLTFN